MDLVYLFHSGFVLLDDTLTVVIDYFEDSISRDSGIFHNRLLDRPGRIYVLSSHYHFDHFSRTVLNWKQQRPDIIYLFSSDILHKRIRIAADTAVWLQKGDCYDDGYIRVKAFGSTDVGISFLIEIGEKRIFHAGDLNNWHWMDESTPEESAESERDYLKELSDVSMEIKNVGLALFPVDPRLGKASGRGALQFMQAVKTEVFMPMHFGESYDTAHTFQHFIRSRGTCSPFVCYRGQLFPNLL